jgi:Dihydrofolate reductase
MTISIIVAMDRNDLISSNSKLPWHIPTDLKYFKRITYSRTVVMGRKTFESIGRTLPNRNNIVITTDRLATFHYNYPNCFIANSVCDVLQLHTEFDVDTFIIGGTQIYQLFLPIVDKMYITHINGEFDGDAYFPKYDLKEWELESSYGVIKENETLYDLIFAVYKCIKNNFGG